MGKVVLMGRNTALSMGRALPGRDNWVLTSSSAPYEGQKTFTSLDHVMERATALGLEEICVIGGGQVYRQTMEQATDLYITHVQASLPADTFFPPISPAQWEAHPMFSHPIDERHAYAFDVVHYTRRNR